MPATSRIANYRYPINYLLTPASSWEEYGLDMEAYLGMAGIDCDVLNNPNATVTGEELVRLAVVGEKLNFTGFPSSILVARHYSFTTMGMLGLAGIAAEDLDQALQLLEKYHPLIFPGVTITMRDEENARVMDYAFDPEFGEALPFLNEVVAGVMRRFSDLCEKPVFAESICFSHCPREPLDLFEAFLGAPVSTITTEGKAPFSEPSRIRIRTWDLATPMKYADPSTLHAINTQLEQSLKKSRPATTWQKKVEHIWRREAHQNRFVTQKEMAERLNVSTRTLVRRLAEEGYRYREMTNQWRLEKAKHLLEETRMPISEVAANVGFEDESAFFRFFRATENATPRQYRMSR